LKGNIYHIKIRRPLGSLRGVEQALCSKGKLAGRYQGFHRFPNSNAIFEIFCRADGWWWWTRAPGSPPKSEAVGPFLTTTEAYTSATMQRMTAND
jgi:hypothetical protein